MKNKPLMKLSALAAMAILVAVAFVGLPTTAGNGDCVLASHAEVTLLAGQDIPVGTVTVWPDHDHNINVEYEISEEYSEWSITEIHFAIAALDDCTECYKHLPITKSGSPKVGNFYYKLTDGTEGWGFVIPFGDEGIINEDPEEDDEAEIGFQWGECLCFAAHAVVEKGEGDSYQTQTGWGQGEPFPKSWAMYVCFEPGKLPTLPESIIFKGTSPGGSSYWAFSFDTNGDGVADASYLGWCLQQYVYMYPNTWYTATPYSSYDDDLPAYDFGAEAWAKINWIINHYHPDSTYSITEIQTAIWYFAGQTVSPNADSLHIIDDADEFGEDFYPTWGDDIAIILWVSASVQGTFYVIDP